MAGLVMAAKKSQQSAYQGAMAMPMRDALMVWISGGSFRMGSDRHYPEESPVHAVAVDGFWMDRFTVSNAEFAAFATATGHVTVAERPLNAGDFPGVKPELLVPGGLVFHMTQGPVDLSDASNW
jgi:formylglycine-generating enzyme required for sulfatase activity